MKLHEINKAINVKFFKETLVCHLYLSYTFRSFHKHFKAWKLSILIFQAFAELCRNPGLI